jgi:hypothetical protein
MKKGKTTLVVLALEIVSIAVLHAVKISHSEKNAASREVSRNISTAQPENASDSKERSIYSLAIFR